MKKAIKNNFLKALLTLMIIALAAGQSMAQREKQEYKTLFGGKQYKADGYYGALMINYGQVKNEDIILVGARGGWIIDQAFTIGLAGYGLTNDIDLYDVYDNEVVNLAGGYGGLLLEPILLPNYPVHIAFPVIIGAGGVAYIDNQWRYHDDNWEPNVYDSDAFFVLEPGIELEFNLTHFLRLGLAATYRYTTDLELYNTDPEVLDGFNFGMSFKFGKFSDRRY